MTVICDCGKEMDCVDFQPGCDADEPSNFVLFECECGASLSGEHRFVDDSELTTLDNKGETSG